MTLQKTELRYRGKSYELMLEDGLVSYVDPADPEYVRELFLPEGSKITSVEGAKRLLIQWLEKMPDPLMTFSD